MGLFWKGIPDSVLFSARIALHPSFFAIETGTFKGKSAKRLSTVAEHVISIESDRSFYEKALKWSSKFENLSLKHGDSGALIGSVLPGAQINCLIWLDAHFSGGNTAGELQPCPLLSELLQVLPSRSASNSIILVDDSRGLIGTSGWPLLSDLIGLMSEYEFSSIIIDDVLIASSAEILGVFANSYSKSRTFSFERLGGRMLLVSGLVRTLGFATNTAFKIKHAKFFSK